MFEQSDRVRTINTLHGKLKLHTRSRKDSFVKFQLVDQTLVMESREYGTAWKEDAVALPVELKTCIESFLNEKQLREHFYLYDPEISRLVARFDCQKSPS